MSYEEDIRRIETIVAELEREDLELDRALSLFEEGVRRLRDAAAALSRAEGQVRTLTEASGGDADLSGPGG